MSHFIGLVFEGALNSYEELLAPYDEQTEDERFLEFVDCTDEVREKWNSLDNDDETKRQYESLANYTEQYYGYDVVTDDEQNIVRIGYSHNPNAKWDWYSEGGRWKGFIKNLEGRYTDAESFSEVDWEAMLKDENLPFCVVTTEGEWHERGEMGWWAMVSNEKDGKTWREEVADYVQSIKDRGDAVRVYAIDFHI